VHAIDDQAPTKSQLREAESAAEAAERQATEARGSVNKASVSQVGAEEAAQNAATIVAQAEEVVHAAQAELN